MPKQETPLDGAKKTILITGCSSGIGRYCASFLTQRGWRVFGTARNQSDLSDLRDSGIEAVHMEMKDLRSIDTGLKQVLDKTNGKLDALFNNAAYGLNGALEDIPTGSLRSQLETNVLAWHHLTTSVLPLMRRQGHGRVVMNGSICGFVAFPSRGPYTISKYAIEAMADSLRLELFGSGVYVSVIQPGPIRTKFRINAYKTFLTSGIDVDSSAHSKTYANLSARFDPSRTDPFELGPEAVAVKLLHAITSSRPRPRYRVTFPTHLFAWVKRISTDRLTDFICRRI